jgi:hypothetical protein
MSTQTSGNTVTQNLVKDIEKFISDYATFEITESALPIALWTIATFAYPMFDAFPYLTITSFTKRSGKTRLGELVSFACSSPMMSGAMTPAAMFSTVETAHPTLFFDEAETLSGDGQSSLTSMLNMGYRKGSKVLRKHGNEVLEFAVYCPKVFILIGDVRDTLRDRSIVIHMKRAEPKIRFVWSVAQAEGEMLRLRITEQAGNVGKGQLGSKSNAIEDAFQNHKGLGFLTDRDEEIWTPLFVIASIFCPDRMKELSRIAVDMATMKTQDASTYVNLQEDNAEGKARDDEYSIRLIRDMASIIGKEKGISSTDAVEKLRELDLAPWRKFKGTGITVHNLADMLARFNVNPVAIRIGKGKTGSNKNLFKGYRSSDIKTAIDKAGVK